MWYSNHAVFHAGIAQSVEQLIRNQQVVCSSHITSSKKQKRMLKVPFRVPSAFFCWELRENCQINEAKSDIFMGNYEKTGRKMKKGVASLETVC